MKTSTLILKINLFVVGLLSFFGQSAIAQITGYTRAYTAGSYTAISGGTAMSVTGSHLYAGGTTSGGSSDGVNFAGWNGDVNEVNISTVGVGFPIGFTFQYGGRVFDRFAIGANGHITLGKSTKPFAAGIFSYNQVNLGNGPFGIYAAGTSNLQLDNSIRALHHSLIPNVGADVRYTLSGTAPNRVLTVQWSNFSRSFLTVDNINFQVKLKETTNTIDFVYGPMTLGSIANTYHLSCMVGLRGVTQEYLSTTAPLTNDRLLVNGTGGVAWATPVGDLVSGTVTMDFKSTNFPSTGTTYTYTPPASYPGCGPIGSLVTVGVVGTTANLSWSGAAFGTPTNYEIDIRANNGTGAAFTAVTGSPFSGTSASITGLTLGSSYECRIRTNCSGTFSKYETFLINVPGPGENCAGAIGGLSIAANQAALSYTVISNKNTQDGPASCAGGSPADDVWYTFTAPSDGSSIVITTAQEAAFDDDWVMEVFDGCTSGSPANLIACNDDQVAGVVFSPELKICQFEYNAGQTYYIRLYTWGSSTAQQIKLGLYKDVACPIVYPYNECVNATVVTLENYGDCPANAATFTTENATPSTGQPSTSCDATTKNDVFIKFNSGAYSSALVNVSLVTATQLGMQVMSACGGTQILCANPAAGFRTISGLTPGQDYVIRFWSNNSSVWGSFAVCVQSPGSCPTDLGPVGVYTVPTVGISSPYTASGRTTCGSGDELTSTLVSGTCGVSSYLSGEDDVYIFDVDAAGLYEITVSAANNNLGIKLFNGCPLAGNTGSCVSAAGTTSSNQKLLALNLSPGNTYYLIVDKANGSCVLSYDINIQSANPPSANDNCAGATQLTQGSVCNYVSDSYNAANTNSGSASCGSADADDDQWFKFTATSTDVNITVSPSSGYTPVIQLFSSCAGAPLCCVTPGAVGEATTLRSTTALSIGVEYYVRVYDYFNGPPSTQDFDICVATPAVPASNCVTCPALSTTETEACGTSSNGTSATAQLVTLNTVVCGKGYAGCNTRDIDYFKFVTTQTGYFTATVNAEFPMVMQIFNTDGATVLGSSNIPTECSGNVSLTNPTALPAGTYYLLVATNTFTGYPCGSSRNDYIFTTSFSVNPPPPPANDNCAGAINLIPCGPATAASTLSATQSLPAILCTGFQGQYALDVWFKFTASSTQHIITANGNFNGVMEVFADNCSGASLTCSDEEIPSIGFETLTLTTVVGKTYYIRYYALATTGFALPGSFSMQVNTPNGWSGAINSDWNAAGNWCSGVPPGSTSNIVIPDVTNDPVMNVAGACNNLLINNGAVVTLNPGNLTVSGSISGTGNVSFTGPGQLVLGGNTANTLSGNLNVQNVQVTNTNAGGYVISSGNNLNVSGVLSPAAGSRLNAIGNVNIISNATQDGSIGVIGSGAQLNGTNYVIQRYVPFTNPGWHFMGSPVVGNNVSQWSDDFDMYSIAPVGGSNGVNLVIEAARASIFKYVEALHNVKLDTVQKDGWRVPVSNTLVPGEGYRVYLKPAFMVNNSTKTVENIGAVNTGTAVGGFVFPSLTRNEYSPCAPTDLTANPTVCNIANRGWNLISNPFPSAINWDAAGWTKPSQMNNAFFIYNGVLGGYRTYVGTGGVSLGVAASTLTNPNLIAKGQGFFVKLTQSGTYNATLKADENVKNSGAASFVRTATASNNLRLRISKVGNTTGYEFDAMVRFMDGASEGFDQNIDAHLLRGTYESVGFKVGDEDMILSSLPTLDGYRVVPVRSFYSGMTGDFKFSFLELSTFPSNVHIYLKDRVLNSIVDVRQNPSYTFTVAATNNFNSNDRFELVFSPTAITEVKPAVNGSAVFSIYPNPSNGSKVVASMIGFENESNVVVTITDVLGKVVYSASQTIGSGNSAEHFISAKLAAGIYNVSCIGMNHKFTTKLVVE